MFNVGGAEFLVIALVALLVLGPDKLPEAARKVGNVMGELRRMSNGFRSEMQAAFNDPGEAAARERGRRLVEESKGVAAATDVSGGSDDATSSGDTGDSGPSENLPE
jgi:sec-independent protein translocase protein TatB